MVNPAFARFKDKELCRVLFYILDSVDRDGSWGGADFEDWKPVITLLTLELLLSCGFAPDSKWTVHEGSEIRTFSLEKSLDYLNVNIRDDGSFGEDFWDACRFGIVLNKYELSDRVPRHGSLYNYIVDSCTRGVYRNREQTWSGPAYYAAAVDCLDSIGKNDLATTILNELIACQSTDGAFHGPSGPDGNEFVHPVWHTSQALITLLRRQLPPGDDRISKIVKWIISAQDSNGCYKAFSRFSLYYTAYAIIGLSALASPPKDEMERSVEWLKSNISQTGKAADSGGTLMTAMALRAIEPADLNFRVSIVDLRRLETLENVSSTLEQENSQLKNSILEKGAELELLRTRFRNADIVLSKKEVFILTVVMAVILMIGGVLLPLWITQGSASKGTQAPATHNYYFNVPDATGNPAPIQFEELRSIGALPWK